MKQWIKDGMKRVRDIEHSIDKLREMDMSGIDLNNLDELREIVKLRKDNPKEYKEFMRGLRAVTKDILTMVSEVMDE